MKTTLKSTEGLVFLSFLTKYNISLINKIIERFDDCDVRDFMKEYAQILISRGELSPGQNLNKVFDESLIALYKLDYYKVKTETIFDKNYPAKLRKITNPPPVLYYKGTMRKDKLVSIVGTREPTKLAEKVIPIIVEIFHRHGYGIVSGLALGIDSIAHRAAIEMRAYTAAIMPNSLDEIYPKEHYGLANQILESKGALISELAFGISHGKKSFVQRNRIQAGMSETVIPVEMGIKSGTMTTVEFAYAQDKYILLVKPKEEYKNLPQYEGVNYFMEKSTTAKYQKTYIIDDPRDLEKFVASGSLHQTTLF